MKSDTLNGFFNLRREIKDYFGYKDDWEMLPIDDERDMNWMLVEGKTPFVIYSEKPITPETMFEDGCCFGPVCGFLTTHRTAYRCEDLVAIPVDTQNDGNKFLMIFTTSKEVPVSEHAALRRKLDLAPRRTP